MSPSWCNGCPKQTLKLPTFSHSFRITCWQLPLFNLFYIYPLVSTLFSDVLGLTLKEHKKNRNSQTRINLLTIIWHASFSRLYVLFGEFRQLLGRSTSLILFSNSNITFVRFSNTIIMGEAYLFRKLYRGNFFFLIPYLWYFFLVRPKLFLSTYSNIYDLVCRF